MALTKGEVIIASGSEVTDPVTGKSIQRFVSWAGAKNKINSAYEIAYEGKVSDIVGYDDFKFSVSNLTQQGGGKPDKDYAEDEWLFDDNSTETVIGSQISEHRFQTELKDGETQLLWYPHIHWMQESAGVVAWGLDVKFCPAGEAEGSWLNFLNPTNEFAYVSGALHQISVFAPIDVKSVINTATEVKVRVYRLGGDVLDTYVGDARFMGFDFHVPIDQARGSLSEFTKEP